MSDALDLDAVRLKYGETERLLPAQDVLDLCDEVERLRVDVDYWRSEWNRAASAENRTRGQKLRAEQQVERLRGDVERLQRVADAAVQLLDSYPVTDRFRSAALPLYNALDALDGAR